MKALFIGGTGTISNEVSKLAANPDNNIELYLLNRGNKNNKLADISGINFIKVDIENEAEVISKLENHHFDVVCNFIVFTPEQAERDIRLFNGKTKQYINISSASIYQKPLSSYIITESTPLFNPYWEYSKNKITCEEIFMNAYRESGFPVTIVRPSHTYDKTCIPLAVHGEKGSWSVVQRIIDGKPVIVHGDGSSLWTLTHSRDFAKAFIGLMGNVHAIGEAVNITSDESLTWDSIYNIIGVCLGKKPVIRHITSDFLIKCDPKLKGGLLGDKTHTVVFDNSKIKRLVPGFAAITRFDQGVCEAVAFHFKNTNLQVPDPVFDEWTNKVIKIYDEALNNI